ncbi:hypothetical protein FMEAI12_3770011 [Parafrankia sp. Ea1.12]|nr:hypothetical protein FMEAI12_3770011 [Parafrankia sp. Ea1.12]
MRINFLDLIFGRDARIAHLSRSVLANLGFRVGKSRLDSGRENQGCCPKKNGEAACQDPRICRLETPESSPTKPHKATGRCLIEEADKDSTKRCTDHGKHRTTPTLHGGYFRLTYLP